MAESKAPAKDVMVAALAKVQAEMPTIKKDSTNPHLKNKYASLDAQQEVALPILAKHGFAWTTRPVFDREGAPQLAYALMHESGGVISGTMKLILQKNDMQGLGSAITYARRYSFGSVLGLSTGEDDDGNHSSQKTAPVQRHYEEPARDIHEEEPTVVSAGQQKLDLVKQMNDAYKERGMLDARERATHSQDVIGKPGATTIAELKKIIANLTEEPF
jgi:hypothetical protein